MIKAIGVAQGGAESHPIQGIGPQFPTIYGYLSVSPRQRHAPSPRLRGEGLGGGASARVVTVVCAVTPHHLNQTRRLFLKLALQRFDLFGQSRVLGDECLDFANRVQHRGVVASAEAAADLRQ